MPEIEPSFAGLIEVLLEDSFFREVGRWLPRLPEFHLPPLNGQMLYDAVAGKYASAGSLDG